jgi:hypothetical protein
MLRLLCIELVYSLFTIHFSIKLIQL